MIFCLPTYLQDMKILSCVPYFVSALIFILLFIFIVVLALFDDQAFLFPLNLFGNFV